MSVSIYDAAAGAIIQQIRMDLLANNLANINTAGFKEDKAVFRSYLSEETAAIATEETTTENTAAVQTVTTALPSDYVVTLDGIRTNFNGGLLMKTGNPLNFALQGSGFFCIQTPNGTEYTRNGSFTINDEGLLSTQDGLPVLGTGGTISIDKENVTIDSEGNIYTVESDGGEYLADTSVGQIKIVDFDEPYPLEKSGNGRFHLTDTSIAEKEAENCEVRQGYVEGSNVNPTRTMTEMIEVLRIYESYQKIIQAVGRHQ